MKAGEIIVTHRTILNALKSGEKQATLEGASTSDVEQRVFDEASKVATVVPGEAAEMLSVLSDALASLQAAEQDPGVFTALPHQTASLLQSFVAKEAAARNKAAPLPGGGLEAQFDDHDIPGWMGSFFTWWRGIKKHPWLPAPSEPERCSDTLRVGVLGDWGTGLYGAPACAASLKNDAIGFQMFLHLGDIYYSGTEEEVADRFLALWPRCPGVICRALNGNHEMYTGGHAYFEQVLPKFGQSSSCFALQNDHWLLVGVDTAFQEHDLAEDQGAWLGRLIGAAGDQRKVVLFSHHQPYSLLDGQGPKLVKRLAGLLADRRIFAWYWGHEHRCVLYDPHPIWGVHGRCVGHSGYPYFRDNVQGVPRVGGSDAFGWYRLHSRNLIPGGVLLNGPNAYLPGQAKKYGCQGYATLEFHGPHLTETFHAPEGTKVFSQQLV
jgi:hypothetical protein